MLPPGRRNQVWVATECGPQATGIYAKYGAAEVAGRSRPTGTVGGFASLAGAEGYVAGLGYAVPDRRR